MKTSRFHKDVYFPPWFKDSFGNFLAKVSERNILYSHHALTKMVNYGTEYGRVVAKAILDTLLKKDFGIDKVFEFYSSGEKIQRVCFRYPLGKLNKDVVIVFSEESTVVTIYVISSEDSHEFLNKSLYEKETKHDSKNASVRRGK